MEYLRTALLHLNNNALLNMRESAHEVVDSPATKTSDAALEQVEEKV